MHDHIDRALDRLEETNREWTPVLGQPVIVQTRTIVDYTDPHHDPIVETDETTTHAEVVFGNDTPRHERLMAQNDIENVVTVYLDDSIDVYTGRESETQAETRIVVDETGETLGVIEVEPEFNGLNRVSCEQING